MELSIDSVDVGFSESKNQGLSALHSNFNGKHDLRNHEVVLSIWFSGKQCYDGDQRVEVSDDRSEKHFLAILGLCLQLYGGLKFQLLVEVKV